MADNNGSNRSIVEAHSPRTRSPVMGVSGLQQQCITKRSPEGRRDTIGILRLDIGKPRRSSGSSVEFRSPPEKFGMLPVQPPSPQPSVDRLSVSFAPEERSGCSVFTPGSPPNMSADKVRFSREAAATDAEDADEEGQEDGDYSASVSAILQRRASSRRPSRRRRRPSSPFSPDGESLYTASSGETAITMDEAPTQEQVYEKLRVHKEVLESVKHQPWGVRRKLRLVQQAKAYVRKHEGELKERLAHRRTTRDVVSGCHLLLLKQWQRARRELANVVHVMVPWQVRIKEIESHFGSAVASYFTFLRWLCWLNLVMSVLLAAFVAVPEMLTAARERDRHPPPPPPPEVSHTYSSRLVSLWNLDGALRSSPIFYGYYSNREAAGYSLPFAYFMTGLAVYVYSFVATLRRMADNARLSKLADKDEESVFTWKLLTGWDYMIGNPETATNRVASLILGFKEALLEEAERRRDRTNWKVIALRLLANVMVLVLLVSSAYAVVLVVRRSTEAGADTGWWRQNEITVVLSLISFLFPMVFELLGLMESYHPRKQLRVQLARIMVLNLLNLYTLIFALFGKIDKMTADLQSLKPNTTVAAMVTTAMSMTPSPADCYDVIVDCGSTLTVGVNGGALAAALLASTAGGSEGWTPPTDRLVARASDMGIHPAARLKGNADMGLHPAARLKGDANMGLNPAARLVEGSDDMGIPPADIAVNTTVDLVIIDMSANTTSVDMMHTTNSPLADMSVNSVDLTTIVDNTATIDSDENCTTIIDTTLATIVEDTPATIVHTTLATIVEDTPATIVDTTLATIVEDTPATIVDTTLAAIVEDTPATIVDTTLAAIVEDTPATIVDTTLAAIVEDTPATIVDTTLATIVEDTPATIVDTTLAAIVEDTPATIVDTTLAAIVEDTPATIVDTTLAAIVEDTPATIVDTTLAAIVESTLTTIVGDDTPATEQRKNTVAADRESPSTRDPEHVTNSSSPRGGGGNMCVVKVCPTDSSEPGTTASTPADRCGSGRSEAPGIDPETRKKLSQLCWETMFGQELVKLTVMDLVLTMVSTLVLDWLRALLVRLLHPCWCWCWDLERQFPQYGDFKIAENILHLVNNQGMVWMGMFFAPGLPLLNLAKMAALMYLRSWAVLTCNVPHAVVFRASRSNNFYLALLLTMLFLCVLPVGYAMVWVEPSWHCGPFSGLPYMYRLLTLSVRAALPPSLHGPLDYLASPALVIPLMVLMVLVICYLLALAAALREANTDLKMQLRRERTEERRKVFQLADRRGGPDPDTPYTRWRKILPVLPSHKPATSQCEDPLQGEGEGHPTKAEINRNELVARLMKRALRTSSATSDEEEGRGGRLDAIPVIRISATDGGELGQRAEPQTPARETELVVAVHGRSKGEDAM